MTKPEPSALLPDSDALRLREKLEGASAAVRFLTGRVIGAYTSNEYSTPTPT